MNNEQFQILIRHLILNTQALNRLADAVERLAPSEQPAPNYQRSIESFGSFNWASIGATVERSDQFGAAIVNWQNKLFTRRSPSNKFGSAIWFSRCTGKDDSGENQYERLITFKPVAATEVEPLPTKVQALV